MCLCQFPAVEVDADATFEGGSKTKHVLYGDSSFPFAPDCTPVGSVDMLRGNVATATDSAASAIPVPNDNMADAKAKSSQPTTAAVIKTATPSGGGESKPSRCIPFEDYYKLWSAIATSKTDDQDLPNTNSGESLKCDILFTGILLGFLIPFC